MSTVDDDGIGRFGLTPAPRGLRLTQDLVNTALAEPGYRGREDLLAEPGRAAGWLDRALAAW
jgi:hypothetical protein